MDRTSLLKPRVRQPQDTAVLTFGTSLEQISELRDHLEYLTHTSSLITSSAAGQPLSRQTENRIIWVRGRIRLVVRSINFHSQPCVIQEEIAGLVSKLDVYLDLADDDEDECEHTGAMSERNACNCEISEILKKAG